MGQRPSAERDARHFLEHYGYELDGMHPQFDGILLASDAQGRYYLFKRTRPESIEAFLTTMVSSRPFVVASSYQRAGCVDENGSAHACEGLLMRKFERSLFGQDFHARCMDIKESNILARDGIWFVR
jgi:hypothetical protein